MAVWEWIWDFGKPIRFLPKSVSAYHYHSGKSCTVLCKWLTIWSVEWKTEKVIITPKETSSYLPPPPPSLLIRPPSLLLLRPPSSVSLPPSVLLLHHHDSMEIPPKISYKQKQNETLENFTHFIHLSYKYHPWSTTQYIRKQETLYVIMNIKGANNKGKG